MMLPEYLSESDLRAVITRAVEEDVGDGDVTTLATVPRGAVTSGAFICKQDGVLAGVQAANLVFDSLDRDIRIDWVVPDGGKVRCGQTVATISGTAHGVLLGERTALNLLQRMSGIATQTRRMVDIAGPYGVEILDTRKTAPGLRALDKWAVRLGGGRNHRIGLFDMILIKDNHIAVAGGLGPAVQAALEFAAAHSRDLEIEVEVRTLDEVREAASIPGIDILLLDNMVAVDSEGAVDTSTLKQAVSIINGSLRTEASGNVSLATVEQIAAAGVNYISCGALTHSASALDLSLQLDFSEASQR